MKYSISILAPLCGFILLSCDNPMRFETKVHEDGSLDKVIVFEKTDSGRVSKNIFDISATTGWKTSLEVLPESQKEKKKEYKVSFTKHFASADEANRELDKHSETQFHIHTAFEKNFRWFYTYIRYSETFRPIQRFRKVKPEEFFNREDDQFIERLPAEKKSVSKADSLYLQLLNEKISDHFARMGIFLEQYDIITEVVKRNGLEKRWLDTLGNKQEYIYNQLDKMTGDPEFALKMMDSLKIPLPKPKSVNDFAELSENLNERINFMSFARDGKYQNIVEMPWEVVYSNADSTAANTLYWRPLVTKFVYKDYVMVAEARKLNVWAVGLSVLLLAAIGYFLMRKRPGGVPRR